MGVSSTHTHTHTHRLTTVHLISVATGYIYARNACSAISKAYEMI